MKNVILIAIIAGMGVILPKMIVPYVKDYNKETERLDKYTTIKQVPFFTEIEKEQAIVNAKNYVYKNKVYICRARYYNDVLYGAYLKDKNGSYLRDKNGDYITEPDIITPRLYHNSEARYKVVNPDGEIIFEKVIKCSK